MSEAGFGIVQGAGGREQLGEELGDRKSVV